MLFICFYVFNDQYMCLSCLSVGFQEPQVEVNIFFFKSTIDLIDHG